MKVIAKQIRYYFEWIAVASMSWFIPFLPRLALLALAKALGSAAYIFDRRGRETGIVNARAVMKAGRMPTSNPEELILRSYQLFARSVCDLFWAARLNKKNYSELIQVEVEDQKELDDAIKAGAMWVTPHYGNFEWISLAMGFRGTQFTLVAQDFNNSLLTGIFKRSRESSGHKVIPSRRAMIRLLKTLKSGGHAAFLTDLTVHPGSAALPIRCFSFVTCVTGLHALLHSHTKAALIPGICIPCADGSYLMKVCRPLRIPKECTSTEIAQQCWNVFEPFIRDYPQPWLWMYRHWRYRPKGNLQIDYPTYANTSDKFERWLKTTT